MGQMSRAYVRPGIAGGYIALDDHIIIPINDDFRLGLSMPSEAPATGAQIACRYNRGIGIADGCRTWTSQPACAIGFVYSR